MENKDYQKRVAAIHDLSGFGKCSLTVALPILSAAGIEACAMPTAILSTHTGGISGYTYRDLTSDMRAFMQHWKSLDIQFDATYSGFLGSFEQLDLVKEFFELFRSKNNLIRQTTCFPKGYQEVITEQEMFLRAPCYPAC